MICTIFVIIMICGNITLITTRFLISIIDCMPIATLMFFIWWAKLKYLLVCFILWIFLVLWVYNFWKYDKTNPESRTKLSYITDRIDNFITDEKEQIKNKTINYQTEQWLIAIWSWGFSWLWFGNSIQKILIFTRSSMRFYFFSYNWRIMIYMMSNFIVILCLYLI